MILLGSSLEHGGRTIHWIQSTGIQDLGTKFMVRIELLHIFKLGAKFDCIFLRNASKIATSQAQAHLICSLEHDTTNRS